jgi:uncharacterized caspase-like protein
MFHVQPEKYGHERSRDKLRVRRGKVVAGIQKNSALVFAELGHTAGLTALVDGLRDADAEVRRAMQRRERSSSLSIRYRPPIDAISHFFCCT